MYQTHLLDVSQTFFRCITDLPSRLWRCTGMKTAWNVAAVTADLGRWVCLIFIWYNHLWMMIIPVPTQCHDFSRYKMWKCENLRLVTRCTQRETFCSAKETTWGNDDASSDPWWGKYLKYLRYDNHSNAWEEKDSKLQEPNLIDCKHCGITCRPHFTGSRISFMIISSVESTLRSWIRSRMSVK